MVIIHEAKEIHDLRVRYTDKIFYVVCGWLICVVVSVLLSGFQSWGFRLSDSVQIAFITSTTVNVVALFVVVAKWLYATGPRKPDASK